MPQQINLRAPLQSRQTDLLSAQIMLPALAVLLSVVAGLCGYWVFSLNATSEEFKKTLDTQSIVLNELQAALARSKVGSGVTDASQAQDLQRRREELLQRETLLTDLQRGLFVPGLGHAARLALIAQSIPAQVWVTELKADDVQLEISGLTYDPPVLNDWANKLALSPLSKDQKLVTVKVDQTVLPPPKAATEVAAPALPVASQAQPKPTRPVWSFTLVSAVDKSLAVSKGKP